MNIESCKYGSRLQNDYYRTICGRSDILASKAISNLRELYGVHAPHVDVNRVLLDVGARVAVTATKSATFDISLFNYSS